MRSVLRIGLALFVCAVAVARSVSAGQVPIAPGPLANAHASLKSVTACIKCHEAGRELSADLCLNCHKPIGERIAARKGVHRGVTDKCQPCHAEHKGADVDLRQLNRQTFDHLAETGFALDGRHAKLGSNCAACHKSRTFLDLRTSCESCHKDVHKDSLGRDCARCHSTDVPFKQTRTRIDHDKAKFTLVGAHRTVACEKCHTTWVVRGLRFDTCTPCHKEPHRHALGPACTSCHTPERWVTRTIEHDRTGFALIGSHTKVACEKCHVTGIVKPLASDRCNACHTNPHRDSLKEDCRKCHNESSFRGAKLDHSARTTFPLVGKHDGLECRQCHKSISADTVALATRVIDFGGLSVECASCHKDQHKGEFGTLCDACHRPATFKTANFAHPGAPDFFGGRHSAVACVRCHVRASQTGSAAPFAAARPVPAVRATTPSRTCASCHADVHLGQVGAACDTCHAIESPKFAPSRFSHDRAAFSLSGKHRALECAKCHVRETRAFPAGTGTARVFKPLQAACAMCHKDPHLGQVENRCDSCHATASFKLLSFAHKGLEDFFGGFHGRLPCRSCHPVETGQFPAGQGTAIRLKVGRACQACHTRF
ncbi:MAG: hypothetical protein WCP29_07030 [Acidobacteriota bacterium]